MTAINQQQSALDSEPVNAVSDRVAIGESATGNLEKVRDILFGNHMRDVDRRFLRLEERITKETRELKDDIKRRLDALEAFINKETESLADHIRQEHNDRIDATGRLSRELADNAAAFERRSTLLDEQVAKGQRELRQQMLEQQQRLSADLRENVDEVLATLAREAHELRNDKTDRQALAALLKEMAMRLTDDFKLPGDEERGNV